MINITISLPMTEEDKKILNLLIGTTKVAPVAFAAVAAVAPATIAKPVLAAVPVVEEEEEDEELVEASPESDSAPTVALAVERATALVASGNAGIVKIALSKAGAKRVSELTPKSLVVFLASLDD